MRVADLLQMEISVRLANILVLHYRDSTIADLMDDLSPASSHPSERHLCRFGRIPGVGRLTVREAREVIDGIAALGKHCAEPQKAIGDA